MACIFCMKLFTLFVHMFSPCDLIRVLRNLFQNHQEFYQGFNIVPVLLPSANLTHRLPLLTTTLRIFYLVNFLGFCELKYRLKIVFNCNCVSLLASTVSKTSLLSPIESPRLDAQSQHSDLTAPETHQVKTQLHPHMTCMYTTI